MKIPTASDVLNYVTKHVGRRRAYRRGTIRTFEVNGHNIPMETHRLGGDNILSAHRDPQKRERTQSRIAWTAFRSLNQLALNRQPSNTLKAHLTK